MNVDLRFLCRLTVNDVRKKKLSNLVYSLQTDESFSIPWAHEKCSDLAPSYVTRVINQLAQAGHLEKEHAEKQVVFRWRRDPAEDVNAWIDRQVYGNQIKQKPEEERPRERLLREGPAKLSTSQLLAILIRVGMPGESAEQAGGRIANHFSGERLAALPEASLHELKHFSRAIRSDSYAQIMAGIELGRRIGVLRDVQPAIPERIRGSEDAVAYCMRRFARLAVDGKQEEFHIVTLDTQHGPIQDHCITVGTLDASLVHPREVFRAAIRDSASAILLVHNHPSGDPTPSREDHAVTDRLTKVGELIGIRVLDHIIVSKQRGVSLLANR